ncbi:hypothetical protein XENTR_v10003505 [Xenopus tropicalis]|nr:hypothetical protein XENTR_v10003505 [Xenopus tropicalis]
MQHLNMNPPPPQRRCSMTSEGKKEFWEVSGPGAHLWVRVLGPEDEGTHGTGTGYGYGRIYRKITEISSGPTGMGWIEVLVCFQNILCCG